MMLGVLGLPVAASAHAAEVDRTMVFVHVLMAVLFVGWIAFFFYTLFRFRAGKNKVADYAGVKSHSSTYLEVAVAIAEAVLLVGFSIPLWAKRVADFPPESESTVVRVVGEQFAWNIHYPGPDGKFGKTDIAKIDLQNNPLGLDREDPDAKDDITTVNQLHVPVGKPVIVKLSSKDVIHSFNLTEFRVKQDAIPGLMIPTWFTPTITTDDMRKQLGEPEFVYEIACAQLCGLGHYSMRGYVTIDTPEQYQAWLDEQAKAQTGEDAAWN
jgi:cytochrome c oxidase subunit 2